MSQFKTPLPRFLAQALSASLNEMIRLDTGGQSSRHLATLQNKCIALRLYGVGIDLAFTANPHQLSVDAHHPTEFDQDSVDTMIGGTPQALLALAVPDWAKSDSGVRIEGDAQVAQALEKLMRQLDPDWEALFVERFGMVAGHQLYRLFMQMIETSRSVSAVGFDQLSDYLRHESDLVLDRSTFSQFTHAVDELVEAIDRLESNATRRGYL